MKKLAAAVLGYGGMGRVHAARYAGQKAVRLVALCDINPAQFKNVSAEINLGSFGEVSAEGLGLYESYEALVAAGRGKIDIMDVCLPAYLHEEYAIRALQDGFHVICEKPMALTSRGAVRMVAAREKAGRELMIAQCVRFDPLTLTLPALVREGRYGRLLRLDMHRYGCYSAKALKEPRSWYYDEKTSGGAILDLHLHDLDFVQAMFGAPEAVACHAVRGLSGGWDDAETYFRFSSLPGAIVSAHGSWMQAATVFDAGFTALFEKAVYSVNAKGPNLRLIDNPTKPVKPPKADTSRDMYALEIDYFARCIQKGVSPERCMPESTANSVALVEAARRSAEKDGAWVKTTSLPFPS
ncbi:MAG: Gfo/Idh/MocA family protein [Kiritimatiellia bacterium]|jgi:predicted dehydrogenase